LGSGPDTETVTIHDTERPGSVDFSFDPKVSQVPIYANGVPTLAVQADGKVLVTGVFRSQSSDALTSVQRLNPAGSQDPASTWSSLRIRTEA